MSPEKRQPTFAQFSGPFLLNLVFFKGIFTNIDGETRKSKLQVATFFRLTCWRNAVYMFYL